MYFSKDGNFIFFALATLCILGYRVSSEETCPIYVPHYCACEITDQAMSTPINMCSFEIEEGIGCKPCGPELQDYANCTSCPGKTCPVCASDESDMQALQKSVSLDTFEDLKKIGQITSSHSFKLAENSSIIYGTDEDQSERTKNDPEDGQNKNEQIIHDENQTTRSSNVIKENQSRSEQLFFNENQTVGSLDDIDEDPNRKEQQFFEEDQTPRNKNAIKEDQNSSDWETSEQEGNTTDQYSSEEVYSSEKINYIIGLKEKNDSIQDSIKEQQEEKNSHDQQFGMEDYLNHTSNYTRDEMISEKYENESYSENENDEMSTKDDIDNLTSETERDTGAPGKYISQTAEIRLDLKSPTTDQLSPLETASSKSFVDAYEITDIDSRKIMDVPKMAQSDKAEKQSRETEIVAETPKKGYINDDKNLNLDNSDINGVKVWFSGERYPSEQHTPDVTTIEDNGDKSLGMKETISPLSDQAFRQLYKETEMPDEEFSVEKVHSLKDIKPSDARSLLREIKQPSDNFESTDSSTSINEMPKNSDNILVDSAVNGKISNSTVFKPSLQPREVHFLRGENSQNDSLSESTLFRDSADKLQLKNLSSELENNSSRYVPNVEISDKMTIEKNRNHSHLTQAIDKKDFSKNIYARDVINHVFSDENNSTIQTLAFDVIFLNYLKYSTGMPDFTTFYFIANLSSEEKVDIILIRICFLNQMYSTITADELNLCKKGIVSIPDSSSLLTVRVQNSYIFKEFLYKTYDEENERTGKRHTLFDGSSLSTNERESEMFNGHDYKLLRKGAKEFVHDNFDFRKLYDLWEIPQNESSDTFRFCHDMNMVRVCKNYKDGIRVHVKIDDRFHVFVSAFLNSATLFDMHVGEFVQNQIAKHSYLMSNANDEPKGKGETHQNRQFITLPETGLSTAFYEEKSVGDNSSLETIEDGSEESSMNLTEESQYDSENDKTVISYSDVNDKVDTNRSKISEDTNFSSPVDTTAFNFSVETGNTDEVSLTRVNDTTEEKLFEMNEPLTDAIQEYKSELEDDNGTTRLRRATNSTKHSPGNWCDYTKKSFNGSITCYQWTYKKECTIECYPGYDYAGEKSQQFTCQRRNNVWVPEMTSCLKGSGYKNENEDLGSESDMDENMKSHKKAKDKDANDFGKVSNGLEEKGPNLLSNYHANDFNFDNYAYDKYNDDAPSDEYE